VEKIKKTLKTFKKRDLNKTFITSMIFRVSI